MFVNESMDYALTMYTRSKDRIYSPLFNSFLVVVIRALCEIYGEEDIIKSYENNDEQLFDKTLMKYGFLHEDVVVFKNNVQTFYEWAKEQREGFGKSIEFSLIQENLIDMMVCKIEKNTESNEEIKSLINFLYIKNNPNPMFKLFNMKIALDQNRVTDYFNDKLINREAKPLENNYQIPVYNIDESLIPLNSEENNIPIKQQVPLTSGNGFVDAMVMISMIVTCGAVAFIIAILSSR